MIMTQVPWIITYTMITTCWLVVCLPYTAVVVWLSVSRFLSSEFRMSGMFTGYQEDMELEYH